MEAELIVHIFEVVHVIATGLKPGKFRTPPTSGLGMVVAKCHTQSKIGHFISLWSSAISSKNTATLSNVGSRRAGVPINQD